MKLKTQIYHAGSYKVISQEKDHTCCEEKLDNSIQRDEIKSFIHNYIEKQPDILEQSIGSLYTRAYKARVNVQ